MKYDRRSLSLTVPTPAASPVAGVLNLAGDFVRIHGFTASNVGTGKSTKIKLTDGLSRVIYLDATAWDFDTAATSVLIGPDVTETGLFYAQAALSFTDATGTAATIAGGKAIWAKNPITVSILDGTLVAGDVSTIALDYSYGDAHMITCPTITTTDTDVDVDVNMPFRYGTLLGFSARSTGTDTAQRSRSSDADGKGLFLDYQDTDYDAAEVHKVIVYDDTLTGLTWQHLDATGAAATATSIAPDPIFRAPLNVAVVNGNTTTDTVVVKVWVDGR